MEQTNGIMNKKIRIAIVGIGNCCSSLIQGLSYYKDITDNEKAVPGLIHPVLGGYKISDIKVVAGFDIDRRKVGKHIEEAIFQSPNNTKIFCKDISKTDAIVLKGPILDGIASHMSQYFQVDENQKELSKEEIISTLRNLNTDLLINYAPVGSQKLTEFWAEIALQSGCAFINAIPQFIASNDQWARRFEDAQLPIIGDDIKSEAGATIVHRAIINMLINRGVKIDSTWQTNVGGNTDFKNMLSESRLFSKKISKTESISSQIPYDTPVYAGPNGYIESLKDNKICNIRIDFKIFGDVSCSLDCKLSVEDSPNSAGVMIDCIRTAKIAIDRKLGGPLLGSSAYYMKHPIKQYNDDVARQMVEEFINGNKNDHYKPNEENTRTATT
jgi:myo-inositol-1-phosphate synthase